MNYLYLIVMMCMLAMSAIAMPQAHASESRDQLDNDLQIVLLCMAHSYPNTSTDREYEAAYVACGGDVNDGYVYDVYNEAALKSKRECGYEGD